MYSLTLRLVLATAIALTLWACEQEVHNHTYDEIQFGDRTGAACDESEDLSWDSFGAAFVTTYCVRCHDGIESDDESLLIIDSHERVIGVRDEIDWMAGSGPLATNQIMPHEGATPSPTLAQREALSRWIACGTP